MESEPAPEWSAPNLDVIRELGLRYEERYLAFLQQEGREVLHLGSVKDEARAAEETQRAMELGAEIIARGALTYLTWSGRPDVLRRVPKPSRFGDWSYEAYDCKLARETRATTIEGRQSDLDYVKSLTCSKASVTRKPLAPDRTSRHITSSLESIHQSGRRISVDIHRV